MVQAVRDRKVSAADLTEMAIATIEAKDDLINAVVVRDFENARNAARKVDEQVDAGREAPLLGLPMTVKESYDLKGFPTTWGSELNLNHVAEADSAVVERLRAAGAVILGKSNVPVMLVDWQANNPIYGRTNNPLDLTRSPGGSSGGSAAALAAGMVPLEMGSDIGGSIRIPAAFCGVYGHKPTHRLVPMEGHAFGGYKPAHPELSVCGPLARCAEDLDLALSVVAGPYGDQAKGYRLALPAPRRTSLKDARILVLDGHPVAETSGDVAAAVDGLADNLARAGAHIERRNAALPDLKQVYRLYIKMLRTITTRRSGEGKDAPSSHEWLSMLDEQARLGRQWGALFADLDAVIMPAFGRTAHKHIDEPDWRNRIVEIDGKTIRYGDQLAWASAASLGNLPSTAFPLGTGEDGMPFGAQIVGGAFEDRTTIALAGMIAAL
jgi:amidase